MQYFFYYSGRHLWIGNILNLVLIIRFDAFPFAFLSGFNICVYRERTIHLMYHSNCALYLFHYNPIFLSKSPCSPKYRSLTVHGGLELELNERCEPPFGFLVYW